MLCFIFKEEVLRYIILKAFIVSCVFLNFSVFGQEAQDDEYADKITNPDYSYTQDEGKEEEEEYLTQKFIDNLRAGKWGASDPDWVNLDLAKTFFPNATEIGRLEGEIPSVSVFAEKKLLGYFFMTRDITSSLGYSSQVFDIVVGLGLDGKLTGASVIKHREPIIGMYTPDGSLIMPLFTAQYKGVDIRMPLRVSLLRTEGKGTIDGISSATVSAVLFNGAILRAARTIALSKG